MIEISFSFAWIFFVLMVMGSFVLLMGIVNKDMAVITTGLLIVFIFDMASLSGSLSYRSHPTNGDIIGQIEHPWSLPDRGCTSDGWCSPAQSGSSHSDGCAHFNWTTRSYDPMVECIAPTPEDNPYERQPLHPLVWIAGGVKGFWDFATGAIHIKVT